jgi:hypothetical protein
MRDPRRIQGRVPSTAFELKRGIPGRIVTTTVTTPTDAQEFPVVSGDWTADGALYYVDVTHSRRSIAYAVQINDDMTGEDLMPERVNRRLDLDKCRVWLAYTPAACTIIIA